MISNPNSLFYACVSRKTTILAEFNSRDAELATLASKCLEKTPPLHTSFSHTIRKKTYSFLIEDPFVYFSISDETLENPEVLAFLKSVKEAFDPIIAHGNDVGSMEDLNSHCFQGEFNPIFHQLLASPAELEGPNSRREFTNHEGGGSLDSPRGKRIGSEPLLGRGDTPKSLKKKKKKKRSNNGDSNREGKDGYGENKVDVFDDALVLSRDFSVSMAKSSGLFAGDLGHQKGKRAWKKHVWVVLSLDLVVCSILFGVWLWICRGFKCIDG